MTSNFLQVGRTVNCGHCSPNFEWIPPENCQCVCHDDPDQKLERKLRYFRSVWGYNLPEDAQKYLDDLIANLKKQ